ncbi:putative CDK4/6 [Rhodofomes roseus]|uniref:non-specific serine/threonine protein kinase n=1 Tax=Rhodofomes roseus TaxID=34475 RepID=A0ABQ8KQ14_9APHY|nr:putative CDK4/6 [Rhodofomes roseus]KAH9840006.1 putative CDK4/6 [Rhodofomes roseus]
MRRSPPRTRATSGLEVIANSRLVEEETLDWEWYSPDEFIQEHRRAALKIGAFHALSGELSVSKYLKTIRRGHVGSSLVRQTLDEFEVTRQARKYEAIVYSPLAITLRGFRKIFRDQALPIELLRLVVRHVFVALDFLHTEARAIHTGGLHSDIQEKNILLGLDDNTAEADLDKFAQQEFESSSPRKINGDRVIYTSHATLLCDLGDARFGEYDPAADIQPYQCRAPEMILDMPWDHKADSLNVGVLRSLTASVPQIWDLFENDNLFEPTGGSQNKQNNIYPLAHMIALLGPHRMTPSSGLRRILNSHAGNWKGDADIPDASLGHAEEDWAGEDKVLFLRFVRKMLKWKLEERASAKELLDDPWLNAEQRT